MEITNLLIKALKKYNININKDSVNNINKFNNLMLEYNKTHNLTSITEEHDVIYKHYLDSLLGLEIINNSYQNKSISDLKIIDIGAGAGFPSIPLSISYSNLKITALDSVAKKTNFISTIKNKLKLDNLTVINSRIEDIANNPEYRENFDIVISRAVANLSTLLEYSAPLLKNGGKIIAYKGGNIDTEISESQNAFKVLDCTIEKLHNFYIDETESKRCIAVIVKNNTINKKYPRKQNKPRINPL